VIYLDNNATTMPAPEVRAAMLPYLDELFANPSSGHSAGMAAKQAVGQARSAMAALIGVNSPFSARCAPGRNAAISSPRRSNIPRPCCCSAIWNGRAIT
jgi:cysteine sulfinate desulfinase/cysteine desulfurase-like protein